MTTCAVLQIFDALASLSHGLLCGVGRQAVGGYIAMFANYFMGLPLSLTAAFGLGWSLSGLWVGVVAGLAV